jgi:uncharacterized protein (DUF1697 family)
MKKYVAFLRAINVGGTKIIKMEDLKKMFESFDLANVQTYIATGNVIFEIKETQNLDSKLENQLEKVLGYKVEIFLRTMEEVTEIANKPPFTPQGNESLHVVLLYRNQRVEKKLEQELLSLRSEADDFSVKGSEVYNLRYDRDKSIFSNNFMEKILKTSTTTRNWNTICKIAEKYK